ncbi:hypothetical protein JMN32_07485 [Fulvivirga sp. 29W222]|uniref:Secreted protein n=1 Tax=Fulvivirga marina TaxID=2494733 RepID=A0A937FUC6_9BACT|nr:hypothetical protein [Fulvivirga marina]MBL6446144.1 hypothetical protein [Fulvivirga marina]
MKLRNLMIVLGIIFTVLSFSACTDESENIVPQPVNVEEPVATVGNEGEDHEPM